MRAVDHRLGPVELPGGVQLGEQELVQPVQTPTWCQSRSRRQQVIPEPKPSSWGRNSHGIAV
ncbi:hypothetical protein [Nonomuraea sp. NBC_01738]|uniref:hypothetical protein n=1 Tax=Nonomuraea sp. NBC_01738 TaxID=2976003 RepID=UPI003FA3CD18